MFVFHSLAVSAVLLQQLSSSSAFTLASNHLSQRSNMIKENPIVSIVSMAEDEEMKIETDESSGVRAEPGSHEELMYTLGVNLARQLGDIRPLVENGEELAQVAKGLLDTVVGRLNDDDQRGLLSKRGKELDELIVGRA